MEKRDVKKTQGEVVVVVVVVVVAVVVLVVVVVVVHLLFLLNMNFISKFPETICTRKTHRKNPARCHSRLIPLVDFESLLLVL